MATKVLTSLKSNVFIGAPPSAKRVERSRLSEVYGVTRLQREYISVALLQNRIAAKDAQQQISELHITGFILQS
jgi:hypothetical protein